MDCAKKTSQSQIDYALISDKSLALFVLVATLVAFLPVLSWLVQRTLDPSDEPWGLVALVTLSIYGWNRRDKLPGWTSAVLSNSLTPALLMMAYALSQWSCPMLVRAILAASIVACFIGAAAGNQFRLSHWALLVMSLPLLPSLQFFLGYPLRVAVAHTVAALVGVSGVTVDGTGLVYHGALVAIDAPCSGMRMLWTSVFLALAISCFNRLSNKQTALLTIIAVVAAYCGNVMRAGSLVYGFHLASFAPAKYVTQQQGYSEFPFFHDVIGAVSFLIVVAIVVACAQCMRPPLDSAAAAPEVNLGGRLPRRQVVLYLLGVCLAVVISCINMYAREMSVLAADEFNGWPKKFEGQVLYPLNMTDWERKFAQSFPGRIAKFSDGDNQVMMRWIRQETRQVHSLQDCLRGAGYTVASPSLLFRDGERWTSFKATKQGKSLVVRERITDTHGGAWTDISEWYWSALTGKTRGPWLAISVVHEVE